MAFQGRQQCPRISFGHRFYQAILLIALTGCATNARARPSNLHTGACTDRRISFPFWRCPLQRRKSKQRDQAIVEAVKSSKSIAGVLRTLNMRVGGGNYATIHRAVRELSLDTSHWTGKGHRKGTRIPVCPAIPLAQLLVSGSNTNSNKLRLRLIREEYLEERCSNCLLTNWQGSKIPLELDHRDGDRANNRLENLRLLCPNCHALTPTYRGRNVRRLRSSRVLA